MGIGTVNRRMIRRQKLGDHEMEKLWMSQERSQML